MDEEEEQQPQQQQRVIPAPQDADARDTVAPLFENRCRGGGWDEPVPTPISEEFQLASQYAEAFEEDVRGARAEIFSEENRSFTAQRAMLQVGALMMRLCDRAASGRVR